MTASNKAPEQFFATRMKELRNLSGISQAALAKAVTEYIGNQVDDSALSRMEKHSDMAMLRMEKGTRLIRLGEAVAIADVLGVPITAMLPKPKTPTGDGERRVDEFVVRAADAAPAALGTFLGDSVAVVLMDHSEDEYPDPNIHELAHVVLTLAQLGGAS